jgi:hypothetical protein
LAASPSGIYLPYIPGSYHKKCYNQHGSYQTVAHIYSAGLPLWAGCWVALFYGFPNGYIQFYCHNLPFFTAYGSTCLKFVQNGFHNGLMDYLRGVVARFGRYRHIMTCGGMISPIWQVPIDTCRDDSPNLAGNHCHMFSSAVSCSQLHIQTFRLEYIQYIIPNPFCTSQVNFLVEKIF